jgi:hypothetical protein
MPIENNLRKLKTLGISADQFVVVGSGPLAIRKIRESKDLDIVVTHDLWTQLSKKYAPQTNEWGIEYIGILENIEVLNPGQSAFSNSSVVPVEKVFSEADTFKGTKFMSLEHLKKVKLQLGRETDLKDISLIDNYLLSQKTRTDF